MEKQLRKKRSTPEEAPKYQKTFTDCIIHNHQYPCNISVSDSEDTPIFHGIQSIPKRRVMIYLQQIGVGKFVTKKSVASDLKLSQAVAGRCLYSLKQDGVIDYQYYCHTGYYITNILEFDKPVHCPFGFAECYLCLFRITCKSKGVSA